MMPQLFSRNRLVLFLLVIAGVQASYSQADTDIANLDLLSFAESWISPQDYAWSRESLSYANGKESEPLSIRDFGRVRVQFIRYSEDAALFKTTVLKLLYETRIPGENTVSHQSPLEGQPLPTAWLHPALGFSVGVSPNVGAKLGDNHQAAEVLDLLDFRGFVPKLLPQVEATWKAEFKRFPDDRFAFEEDTRRTFKVLEMEDREESKAYTIEFKETTKISPRNPGATSELRDKQGTYKVLLPEGRIDEITWTGHADEWFETSGVKTEVETTSKTSIIRRDVVEKGGENKARPEVRKGPREPLRETDLPRPPR